MPGSDPPSPHEASSAVVWDEAGRPRSRRHGDIYFSAEDGLAESRAVFLEGCGLPAAWAGRPRFTVGELGFGTGLNIAALLDLWRGTRDPGARLHVFTMEADPLTAAEAARALSAWPELAEVAAALLDAWPGSARGFHRMDLSPLGAVVDVAVMEAADALAAWSGAADAWFLDGFAPALNPDIWRDEVIALVARRSAAGARAATYTVAGQVRRALRAAGFAVERRPGHGRKRQRLEARLPAAGAYPSPVPRIAVIGAGIAGASLARAFGALGLGVTIFDQAGPGAGGSGAPAALAAPRLDAGLGPAAGLFAQAARHAARLYEGTPGAVIARGALQLTAGPKDPRRFAAIAGSDLFEPGSMRQLDETGTSARLGEAAAASLAIAGAVVVEPKRVLTAWLGGEVARVRIVRLKRLDEVWRLIGEDGETAAEAEVVCLAGAMGVAELAPEITMTPVRGQASFTEAFGWTEACLFGGYVIPTRNGVLVGATHDRDDTAVDLRDGDRQRNLTALAGALPRLAGRLAASPLRDWSAVRATTGDYLPLAGPVPRAEPGLMVLTGLGSRGFCLAPLLADHIAARVAGAPSPLPSPLADLVDPARFAARAARKGRPRSRS